MYLRKINAITSLIGSAVSSSDTLVIIHISTNPFQGRKKRMQGRRSKPKASLTASHSSTVAEELVVLLRHLHSFDSWNHFINDFISARLNSIAETASQAKV